MSETKLVSVSTESLREAAALIRAGMPVAFPTETVYGLGADAMSGEAVKKIFAAKGRPGDNPLIVHVCCEAQMRELCREWNGAAQALCDAFMPGPITVVLPKAKQIPCEVTAGLDSVGLRFSAHPAAIDLIRMSQTPIAAPSANLSGSPSPTTAQHVFADMNGRIPMILDGGACAVGMESTVISLAGKTPKLLRPGGVTVEQLREVLGTVEVHPSVLQSGMVDRAASPGMKYKHYSPKARVVILDVSCDQSVMLRALESARAAGLRAELVCAKSEKPCEDGVYAYYNTPQEAAAGLFDALRRADGEKLDLLLVKAFPLDGLGLGIMNRLLRAASFTVLRPGDVFLCKKDEKDCEVIC